MHNDLVSHFGAKRLHQRDRAFLATQVDFFGLNAEHRLRPGPASLLITYHLNLVNDSHIDTLIQWRHLHGAACEVSVVAFRYPLFFASDQSASLVLRLETGVCFVRQQTQRASVDTALRFL